ncbi:hypothetical protein, partial [uncultured Bosea sp.]|uniref:hypothetical protein n=1 Tax=uncultured Bosea sp. TaxID=211457 RepID=UPI0025DF323B
HATENRSVGGSIPPLGTIYLSKNIRSRPELIETAAKFAAALSIRALLRVSLTSCSQPNCG